MREYLTQICKELEFPREAADTMIEAWEAIASCPEAFELWQQWIKNYEIDCHMDYKAALADADQAARLAGVHKYTAELLLFLCLTKRLKVYYQAAGIEEEIWHDSCMDLHWKLMECKKVYGIWGSFVAFWFPGFFELRLFALGRLQFELIDFPKSYEKTGRKIPEGVTKAINVHIPSCGKLNMDECRASYKKAAQFFADAFPGDIVVFYCWSWLLFEPQRSFLNADSGIVKFMNDFDIYRTGEQNGDLWRIFDREYDGDPASLPENTSLQRAYKNWLKSGKSAGFGEGIFEFSKIQQK